MKHITCRERVSTTPLAAAGARIGARASCHRSSVRQDAYRDRQRDLQTSAALPQTSPLELAVDQDPLVGVQHLPPAHIGPAIGLLSLLGPPESAAADLLRVWQDHIRPSCVAAWEHLSEAHQFSIAHLQLLDACLGTLQLVASSTGHACVRGHQHPVAAASQDVFIASRQLLQAICSDQTLYMALSKSHESLGPAMPHSNVSVGSQTSHVQERQLCLQLLHHMEQQSQIPLVRSND
jgi:hypothetical protein